MSKIIALRFVDWFREKDSEADDLNVTLISSSDGKITINGEILKQQSWFTYKEYQKYLQALEKIPSSFLTAEEGQRTYHYLFCFNDLAASLKPKDPFLKQIRKKNNFPYYRFFCEILVRLTLYSEKFDHLTSFTIENCYIVNENRGNRIHIAQILGNDRLCLQFCFDCLFFGSASLHLLN